MGSAPELPEDAIELAEAWQAWNDAPTDAEKEFAYRTMAATYRQGHLLRAGEIVADRYQVRRAMSDGALASRWAARDLIHDRPVSLEVLQARFVPVPGLVEAFHEAGKPVPDETTDDAVLHAVRPIDEGGEWEGFHWIATDAAGVPLTEARERLDAIDMRQTLLDVGDALHGAHQQGRAHGALDPAHVVVADDGQARLGGFGMVPPAFAGTPMAAPESAAPNFEPTAATDRYSFAMLVVWTQLGEIPYWAMRDPERLLQETSWTRPLKEALAASWALDPLARPDELVDLLRALRGDADNVRALARRAVEHERWPTALGHYRQLLALTRGDADVRVDLAICLARAGQDRQAMDQLLACLRTPGLKRDEEAIAELLDLARASTDPDDVQKAIDALSERANAEGAQKDVITLHIARLADGSAAVAAWERAMASHTSRPQAEESLRELVRIAARDNDWGAFVHWGGQLVDFEPSEAAGRLAFRVGEACQTHLRDPNGALFWLTRAKDEGYDHADLHQLIEVLQVERGDWDELADVLEHKALDADDAVERVVTLRRAARILRRAGRQPDRAAALYERLLEDRENDGEARWFLARHARAAGDIDAEREHLQHLDPVGSDLSPSLRVEAGLRLAILLRDHDHDEAEQLTRRLLVEFPDHTGALRLAVAMHRDGGRHEEIHPLLLRLASIHQAPSENWAQVMLARAELMWRYGEVQASFLLAEEVAERLPNHLGAAWGMSRCMLAGHGLRDELGVDLSTAPFTPHEALARLLDLLIDLDALKAFVDLDPLGEPVARSPLEKAAAAVDRLLAHGAVDGPLFDRLTELCPERIDAIRLVERLWEPGGVAGSFPIARTYAWNRVPLPEGEDVQRKLLPGRVPSPLWQAPRDALDMEPLLVASSRSALPEEGGPASLMPHVPAENQDLVVIVQPGGVQQLLTVAPFEALSIGSGDDDTLQVEGLPPGHVSGVRVAGRMYLTGEGLTVKGRPVTEVRLAAGVNFAVRDIPVAVMDAVDAEGLAGDDLTDFLDEVEDSEVLYEDEGPTFFDEPPPVDVLALVRVPPVAEDHEGEPLSYLVPLVEDRTELPDGALLEQEEDGLRLTHGTVSRFVVVDETFGLDGVDYTVVRIEPNPPNPGQGEEADLVPALVLDDGSPMGAVVIVDGPKKIGRARDVQVQIRNDAKVSRVHATVEPRDDGVYIVDHGASNGTYVGEDRIVGERLLRSGDRLIIGDTILEYRMWADERAAEEPELADGADTLMGATIRAASAELSIEEGCRRLDVANRALGAMLKAVDAQDGAGAGRAELQLIADASPRRFKPLFKDVEVQRTGLPVMPVLFNTALLATTAQRAVLSSGLQDLIERAVQRFGDLVEGEASERMLEAVAKTNYRKHLRL